MTKQQFEIAKEMWADNIPVGVIAVHLGITAGAPLCAFIAARPQHFAPRKVAA